jgi:hypothetical protein
MLSSFQAFSHPSFLAFSLPGFQAASSSGVYYLFSFESLLDKCM